MLSIDEEGLSTMLRYLAPLALITLTACDNQEQQPGESAEDYAARIGGSDTAPSPTPALTSNPQPTADAEGNELTAGQWFITENASGATAMFGAANTEPLFTIACRGGSGPLVVTRSAPPDAAGTYSISAGASSASVAMRDSGGELPMIEGTLAVGNPVLQALAQQGASGQVTGPDGDVLRIPGAPGLRRVVEACQ